jgi:hypothetical protein
MNSEKVAGSIPAAIILLLRCSLWARRLVFAAGVIDYKRACRGHDQCFRPDRAWQDGRPPGEPFSMSTFCRAGPGKSAWGRRRTRGARPAPGSPCNPMSPARAPYGWKDRPRSDSD